jgi:hypothetical protein
VSDYSAIKGKCVWWREAVVEEDRYNVRLKDAERRIQCSCFVEGKTWKYVKPEVPPTCPEARHCRYYIKYT